METGTDRIGTERERERGGILYFSFRTNERERGIAAARALIRGRRTDVRLKVKGKVAKTDLMRANTYIAPILVIALLAPCFVVYLVDP